MYCGTRCQQDDAYQRFVQAWLAGEVAGVGSWATLSRYVRRYLLLTQGFCSQCGWAERHPVTGKIPLHIDHIDGDWRNNRPDNLRLLCPNCHALTASYGALNRGRGRPYHMVKRGPTI